VFYERVGDDGVVLMLMLVLVLVGDVVLGLR
jgi:hypothetical protein